MSGGSTKINGGINHSGKETISATAASKVEPNDHATLVSKEPPFLRSSLENRRSATKATIAGVISHATNSSDAITMTGSANTSTTTGASTLRKRFSPSPSSHTISELTSSTLSRLARTHTIASSQKK